MALDKLVDSTQLDADLTSVANAIRTKGGTSAQLAFPSGFVSAIQAIPSGGGGFPAGYEQYETLNVRGAPILLDYIPAQKDSLDIMFSLYLSSPSSNWLFTSGTSGNRFALLLQPGNNNGRIDVRNINATNVTINNLRYGNTPHVVKMRPSAVFLDTTQIGTQAQQTANGEKLLICGNPDGTNPFYGYLWFVAIRRNNENIHYYVPAVRTADSQAGLMDIITETFYTNTSTGELIAEGKVLPDSVALSMLLGGQT